MKIGIEEIRAEAQRVLDDDGKAGWQAKAARFRAAGRSEEFIARRRKRHFDAVAKQQQLARRVLKKKPESFRLPASHGGEIGKDVYRTAAVSWFGMEAEPDFPHQALVIRSAARNI